MREASKRYIKTCWQLSPENQERVKLHLRKSTQEYENFYSQETWNSHKKNRDLAPNFYWKEKYLWEKQLICSWWSIFSKPERPLIATFSIPLFFTITISKYLYKCLLHFCVYMWKRDIYSLSFMQWYNFK